jgi:predicted Fe-Mo cluster-binding NifX family protein
MKITFALALNEDGIFEKKHFGDSDKFAFYTYTKNELKLKEELPNIHKSMDEVHEHGSKKKGNAIISFLKEKGVNVLVSKQFGKNISMINQHFIPVIIVEKNPDQVIEILLNQMNWFKDELKNRKTDFMLFRIKNGILKSEVKTNKS